MLAAVEVDTLFDTVDAPDLTSIAALQNDPGPDTFISLREAIMAANASSIQDNITFNQALDGDTIYLTYLLDGDGSRDLDIEQPLTIDATTLQNGITIDADSMPADLSRVLQVQHPAGSHTSLDLKNVTVTGGYVEGGFEGNGGGILATNADLTIENSVISGNKALLGDSGYGGGIFATASAYPMTIDITDSTISGNIAGGFGGGIYIQAQNGERQTSIHIKRTTIQGNTSQRSGGGLYYFSQQSDNHGPVLTTKEIEIVESTISGNTALKDGAGAFINFNGANDEASLGSDIQLHVSRSTFSGNDIINGGIDSRGAGLYFCEKYHARATFENSTFSGNNAHGGKGGGVYIGDNGRANTIITSTFRNVTITKNQADNGGGLFLEDPAPVMDTTLHNTIIDGNFDGPGTTANNVGVEQTQGSYVDPNSSNNLVGPSDQGAVFDVTKGNILDFVDNDPRLEPLANHGGLTQVHRPMLPDFSGTNMIKGSQAIDHGNNAEVPTPDPSNPDDGPWDQRGGGDPNDPTNPAYQRIVAAIVDIGAVELQKDAPGGPRDERGRMGDMNFDGKLDFDDIAPFSNALNDPVPYENTYGVPPSVHGDYTENGVFDFDDIAGFVADLMSQSSQSSSSSSLTEAAFQQLFSGTVTGHNAQIDQLSPEQRIIKTLKYAASLDPQTQQAEILEVLNLVLDMIASVSVTV